MAFMVSPIFGPVLFERKREVLDEVQKILKVEGKIYDGLNLCCSRAFKRDFAGDLLFQKRALIGDRGARMYRFHDYLGKM